ncbi:MAG: endonuclease/exonuclease/phosphatase family protein [Lysobacterales bacterium]
MARLRIATWNMHGGVGLDGRFSSARIARVIGELDADVIALQEFGSRRAGFDLRSQLETAAAARAIVMPTLQKYACDFGNAVLTRWPARDVACHALGVDRREPRNAIDLLIDHGGGTLRIVVTHLGLRVAERRTQIARLQALLGATSAERIVLLGDFNEWRPRNALRAFDQWFGMSMAPATFPSPCPVAALDRIWVAPASACVDLRVHRSRAARIASDHLPLVATLEFP